MSIKVSECFLVHAINPVELFAPNLELYAGFSKVSVKLTVELSGINHQLLMLLVLFPKGPLVRI